MFLLRHRVARHIIAAYNIGPGTITVGRKRHFPTRVTFAFDNPVDVKLSTTVPVMLTVCEAAIQLSKSRMRESFIQIPFFEEFT